MSAADLQNSSDPKTGLKPEREAMSELFAELSRNFGQNNESESEKVNLELFWQDIRDVFLGQKQTESPVENESAKSEPAKTEIIATEFASNQSASALDSEQKITPLTSKIEEIRAAIANSVTQPVKSELAAATQKNPEGLRNKTGFLEKLTSPFKRLPQSQKQPSSSSSQGSAWYHEIQAAKAKKSVA